MAPGDYEQMILSMPERVQAVLANRGDTHAGRWRYRLYNIARTDLNSLFIAYKFNRSLIPSKRRCPPQSQLITTTPIPAGQVDCIPEL
jgi:hypothetical protein